jgi:hypothetical protein
MFVLITSAAPFLFFCFGGTPLKYPFSLKALTSTTTWRPPILVLPRFFEPPVLVVQVHAKTKDAVG